jgi:hypothetical protein
VATGLVVLWLILLVMQVSLGGLIHLLLVIALGVALYGSAISGRA